MQNVMMKIDAVTLQRILERHINESLAPGKQARVTMVIGNMATMPLPNQPNHEIQVTFDAVVKPD